MLIRLVYFSSMSDATSPLDVEEIIEAAVERNAEHEVTGALFGVGQHFVQVLEGRREDVSSVYHLIVTDSRHYDVTLVSVEEIEARRFGRWSMVDFSEPLKQDLEAEIQLDGFEPNNMRSHQLMALLDRCMALAGDRAIRAKPRSKDATTPQDPSQS